METHIGNHRLSIRCDSPQIEGYLDAILEDRANQTANGHAHAEICFPEKFSSLPTGVAGVMRQLVELETPRVCMVGDWSCSVERRKILCVNKEMAFCMIRESPSSVDSFYYNHFHPLVVELLSRLGVFYLHAGAIFHESLGSVLVAGPRGSGKTTTCLSLLSANHRLLSDDTVFINLNLSPTVLTTLLRPLHPDRRLVADWDLDRYTTSGNVVQKGAGRYELNARDHFQNRLVKELSMPEIVLLPRTVPQMESVVVESTMGETAATLLPQIYPGFRHDGHDSRLVSLARRLFSLPAYHLHLGKDAFESSNRLSDLISETLTGRNA